MEPKIDSNATINFSVNHGLCSSVSTGQCIAKARHRGPNSTRSHVEGRRKPTSKVAMAVGQSGAGKKLHLDGPVWIEIAALEA